MLAFAAAVVVVCAFSDGPAILQRLGIMSVIGGVWLLKIWPWD